MQTDLKTNTTTAIVDVFNIPTNTYHPFTVTWRDQTFRCHGQTWAVADQEHPPFYADGNQGRPHGSAHQCGNCGTIRVFHFTATER